MKLSPQFNLSKSFTLKRKIFCNTDPQTNKQNKLGGDPVG